MVAGDLATGGQDLEADLASLPPPLQGWGTAWALPMGMPKSRYIFLRFLPFNIALPVIC